LGRRHRRHGAIAPIGTLRAPGDGLRDVADHMHAAERHRGRSLWPRRCSGTPLGSAYAGQGRQFESISRVTKMPVRRYHPSNCALLTCVDGVLSASDEGEGGRCRKGGRKLAPPTLAVLPSKSIGVPGILFGQRGRYAAIRAHQARLYFNGIGGGRLGSLLERSAASPMLEPKR
jgi:hypothetical protein